MKLDDALELVCDRCHMTFLSKSKRSRRCDFCQKNAERERHEITKMVGTYKDMTEGKTCTKCGGTDNLEPHLEQGDMIVVICRSCHDSLHSMDTVDTSPDDVSTKDAKSEGDTAPDDVPLSPHDVSGSTDDVPPSPHDVKNIQKEDPKEEPKKMGSNYDEVWSAVLEEIKEKIDYDGENSFIKSIVPLRVINGDTLVTFVTNNFSKEWADKNVEKLIKTLRKTSGVPAAHLVVTLPPDL